MLEENKEKSIEYWNRVSKNWGRMAFDEDGSNLVFPSSKVRTDIVINEIERISKNKEVKILDIGCANGKLVRALIRKGFTNVKGIDNSPKMIEESKKQLKKEFPDLNPEKVFSLEDADNFLEDKKFDFISAMGLIEYAKNINYFFAFIYKKLNPQGIAFIESRNKLFNLVSANKYTAQIEDINQIISELENIKNLSPINERYSEVVLKNFINIGDELKNIELKNDLVKPKFEKYPFDLPQYTPKEVISFCKQNSLKLKEVIYYHCHPFPPRYEKEFPQLFNRLGLLMQPLGYTPLGATICSSFIAIIEK